MTELFLNMAAVSVTAGALLLPLLLFSGFLNQRIRMSWKKGIWFMLAVRLLIPIPFPEAVFHVRIPDGEMRTAAAAVPEREPAGQVMKGDGIGLYQAGEREAEGSAGKPGKDAAAAGDSNMLTVLMWIWALTAIVFILFCLTGYLSFSQKLKKSAGEVTDPVVRNTFLKLCGQLGLEPDRIALVWSSEISLPCAYGYIRPRICLPERKMEEQELSCLLKHELYHIRQHDLWYKLLFLIVNALYWFHPLVYLMRREAYKDMECRCDELVIKDTGPYGKKTYAQVLLSAVSYAEQPGGVFPTGFSENRKSLEGRLRNVMNGRKKRLGTAVAAAITAALLLLLTGSLFKLQQPGAGRDLLTRLDLTQEEENEITNREMSGTAAKYSYEIDGSYRRVTLQLEMWEKGELQDILGEQTLPLRETKGELTAAFDSDAIFQENQEIGWRAGIRQIPEGFFRKRTNPEAAVTTKWSIRLPREPEFIGAAYGCLGELPTEKETVIEEGRPIVLAQLIMDADNRLELISIDPTDKETLRTYDLVYLLTCRFSKEEAV
ncbi:M56 family metallopeptidase [Diplocloster hominis]|uniref:M56 family metallopeptidase n=1 Tax=Diplocloster hominis TaxID=3079010 RepID=UPI0031BA681B